MEMFASVKRSVFDQQQQASSTSTSTSSVTSTTTSSVTSSTGNEQGTPVTTTTATVTDAKGTDSLLVTSNNNNNGQLNQQQNTNNNDRNHNQWMQQQQQQGIQNEHHHLSRNLHNHPSSTSSSSVSSTTMTPAAAVVPGSVTVNQPHSQLHQQTANLTLSGGEFHSTPSIQNNPSPGGGDSLLKTLLKRRFICSNAFDLPSSSRSTTVAGGFKFGDGDDGDEEEEEEDKVVKKVRFSDDNDCDVDGGGSGESLLGVHGIIVHHNQHPLASSITTVEFTPISRHDVLITQPYSLPTSPVASPRPTSSSSSSIIVPYPCAPSPTPPSEIKPVVVVNPSVDHQQSRESRMRAIKELFSSKNSTDEQDWQASKTGVRERNAAMCNNDLMADIRFVVSNNGGPSKSFPAHKYVLATGSSVFFAMFYGPLAEMGEEIVVPDVEPDAFLKMLRYLYADEIVLDEDSVLPTLHVAKKYFIPHLAKACVQYMEASLTARNACILLCQSRMFDEPDLMQRCWEVIDAQAEMAFNSDGFIDIDHATLSSILSRETLNCKELHLFNATMAWATAECDRREIDASTENLRAVLGNCLQLLRVPTMELHEFADGPAQMGIFSLKECHDMFLHFTASCKPKLAYPVTPRQGLKPQVCHRFQSSAYRSNQWRYRGRCDSIQFLVDRRIFIVGFGLYGSSTGATTYGVHIELKRQGRILAENNTEFFSDGSSNTFHVFFRQPVQIDPDIYYTASAVLDGMELSYFGQEGMSDVTVGNVTFQFQCSTESTNGTGVQGGQIPELIFYGPSSN